MSNMIYTNWPVPAKESLQFSSDGTALSSTSSLGVDPRRYQPLVDLIDQRITTLALRPAIDWDPYATCEPWPSSSSEFFLGINLVAADAMEWRKLGHWFRIHIPVSADVMMEPLFGKRIGDVISRSPNLEGRLHFVLHGIGPTHDLDTLRNVIRTCMIMGVDVGLDGFGDGYSDLRVLSKLSLTSLVISARLIDQVETNQLAQCVLKGIVAVADEIGLDVIADGVKAIGQLSLLRQIGFNQAKGDWVTLAFGKNLRSLRV